jgi:glycerol kinase
MSDNPTFVQALANATSRPVEIAAQREATTLGAGLLGGFATGAFAHVADIGATWRPRARVEPTGSLDRDRWREASGRATGWIAALSGVDL